MPPRYEKNYQCVNEVLMQLKTSRMAYRHTSRQYETAGICDCKQQDPNPPSDHCVLCQVPALPKHPHEDNLGGEMVV